MPDVFDEIRTACRRVSDEASWVHINHDRLDAYAGELPLDSIGDADPDPGRNRAGDDEATASFVISLDAINFGSGYFPHLRKRPGMSGYYTVATALREHVEATGVLTARRLMAITAQDCARVFGQDLDGGPAEELMTLFASALVHLGETVQNRHDGSFTQLVRAAEGSAAALVGELGRIVEFHDVATYRGFDVPLYKRAQITAYDLSEALGCQGLGHFHDLDRLTMFADNLVPHVLRVDGVLGFDPQLVARIDRGEDIPSGSEPEVEIRAVAVHAVELLLKRLRANEHDITTGRLDSLLWNRGAGEIYKEVARHRTRCTFY